MCSPTMRATTSVGPPAANGTITLIGLFGYWAADPWANPAARAANAMMARRLRIVHPFARGHGRRMFVGAPGHSPTDIRADIRQEIGKRLASPGLRCKP